MTIGFFTDGYAPQVNGVATSVESTAKALRKKGHKVFIIAPKYPDFKDKDKNVIRLQSIPFYKGMNLRVATHLPEKAMLDVSKIPFDVIHGHSGGTVTIMGLEIAKIKNIPYVFTYHTLWNRYTHYVLKGKILTPKMAEIASRVFSNRCDYVIAPTERVKKELKSYGVKKPITVIPSGIDIERFEKAKKGYLRKKLGLRKEKILLYAGRLGKEKSIDFIIKAFEKVSKKDSSTVLVIAGYGPEEEKLKKLAKKLNLEGKVLFTGLINQKDMPKVYKDAQIFLFASKTETQGLVVIEAMASGLPVVGVNDPAIETMVVDGQNGFITKRDPGEFSRKILEMLSNEELLFKFSKESKKHAEGFSLDKVACMFESLYKELVSN